MNLIKDSFIYTSGQLVSKLVPFLLIPYLSNQLGIAEYGNLALMQSYLMLILVFIGLSQNAALARYYYRYGSRGVNELIDCTVIISTLLVSPLVLFSILVESIDMLLVAGAAFFQVHFLVRLSYWQSHKKAIQYVGMQFSYSLLLLVFCVLYYELGGEGYIGYFYSVVFAYVLVLSFPVNRRLGSKKIRFHIGRKKILFIRYLFVFGGGLFFHQLALFGKAFFDRIILSLQYTDAELGVYSIGYQLASGFQVLFVAINTAVVPYFYEALKKDQLNKYGVVKYFKLSLMLIPVIGLSVGCIPEEVFLSIFSSVDVKYYFVLFSVGISINASYFVLANYFFYVSNTAFISKINTVSVIFHLLMIFWFASISMELVPFALIVSNLILILFLLNKINKLNYSS